MDHAIKASPTPQQPAKRTAAGPAPITGPNPDPATGPVRVAEPKIPKWDGSGTSNVLGMGALGALVGGALTVIPAGIAAYLGGDGAIVGAGLIGLGMLFGAAGFISSDRKDAKQEWIYRHTPDRGSDIDSLVNEFMLSHENRGERDKVLYAPREWRSDTIGSGSKSYYLDHTKLMQQLDTSSDGQVAEQEVTNRFRSFDADRNGGLDDAEYDQLQAWQDKYPADEVDTGTMLGAGSAKH